jgi:hypothetical protein
MTKAKKKRKKPKKIESETEEEEDDFEFDNLHKMDMVKLKELIGRVQEQELELEQQELARFKSSNF